MMQEHKPPHALFVVRLPVKQVQSLDVAVAKETASTRAKDAPQPARMHAKPVAKPGVSPLARQARKAHPLLLRFLFWSTRRVRPRFVYHGIVLLGRRTIKLHTGHQHQVHLPRYTNLFLELRTQFLVSNQKRNIRSMFELTILMVMGHLIPQGKRPPPCPQGRNTGHGQMGWLHPSRQLVRYPLGTISQSTYPPLGGRCSCRTLRTYIRRIQYE